MIAQQLQMFAKPRKKPTQARGYRQIRPPVFKESRVSTINREILKKASVRTFQPCVLSIPNSSNNSQYKSLAGSEEDYQKLINGEEEEPELFRGISEKRSIDEQLTDILECIQREKEEIGIELSKLRCKMQEERESKSRSVLKVDAETSTRDLESELNPEDRNEQAKLKQQKSHIQRFIEEKLREYGLEVREQPILSEEDLKCAEDEVEMNKVLIKVMLEIMGE